MSSSRESPDSGLPGSLPISIEAHSQGAIVAVRAQAGGRRNGLRGIQAGELRISVTQVPERGKANKILVQVLSDALQVARSRVELISGETSPRKRFLIHGLTVSELASRLAAVYPAEFK